MILKFLFAAFMIYLTLALFKKNKAVDDNKNKEDAVDLIKDPICGTFVDKETGYKVKFYDKIYYFCSEECRDKFIKEKKSKGDSK
jgi:YHS domain-containing protein